MICNMDCFHCEYEDCIRPETQDANERAKEWIRNNPERRKLIRRRYYEKHREQEIAAQKARYQKYKDMPGYKEKRAEDWQRYKAKKKAEVS